MIIVGCAKLDCVYKTEIICTQKTGVEFYDYCDDLFSKDGESFRDYINKKSLAIDNTGYGEYVLVSIDILDFINIVPSFICCSDDMKKYCDRNYSYCDIITVGNDRATRFDVYRELDDVIEKSYRNDTKEPTYSELQAKIVKLKAKNKELTNKIIKLVG